MAKDQPTQARQPQSRNTRSQPSAPRNNTKNGFIKPVNQTAHLTPPGTPRKIDANLTTKSTVNISAADKAADKFVRKPSKHLTHSPKPSGTANSSSPGKNQTTEATPKIRKRPLLVSKAKKLALRPQDVQTKARQQYLRDKRDNLDDIEPVRLQKAMAASGVASRRESEELIVAGLVLINGKTAELGNRVCPRDKLTVKGKAVHLIWQDRLPRILIYHKQEGEIVSRDDPEGRASIFDRLPQAKSSRWVTIGRLDVNTSGLLILTTHGGLAHRFAHPSFEVDREYAVRLLGRLSEEQRKLLLEGILLDDGPAQFDALVEQDDSEGANHWYRVAIREGRNREVRRVFESMGLVVSRLIRVRFGPIGLPARLKRGQFYELNEVEVSNIMKWAGLDLPGTRKKHHVHE